MQISSALDALPELVAILDAEGAILEAFGSVAWISKAAIGSLPGRPFDALLSDQDPVRLIGVVEVLTRLGGDNLVVLASTEEGAQSVPCLLTGASFECDGARRWIVSLRATRELQAELAEQARHAATEREKADALELARRELELTNAELQRTQADLVKASRIAGMAEIATSVLHNVGNVLNGMNVGVTVMRKALLDRPGDKLVKVVRLLEDLGESPNPQKLAQVAEYLRKLAIVVDEQLTRLDKEAASFGEKVEHVNSIVASQQKHARPAGICEAVDVGELLREAVRLHAASMAAHAIEVEVECQAEGRVVLDRHKVLQILVNLVSNARHAMKESPRRVLTMTAAFEGEMLEISCRDTGVGMGPGTLAKLFTHGFTTKPDGHGFGLHAGVNSAREMGGDLFGTSAGLGCGSCFTLTMPRTPAGRSAPRYAAA